MSERYYACAFCHALLWTGGLPHDESENDAFLIDVGFGTLALCAGDYGNFQRMIHAKMNEKP